MKTFTSKLHVNISVDVYPESECGAGSGYYFYRNTDPHKTALSPNDLREQCLGDVLNELKPLATKAWRDY